MKIEILDLEFQGVSQTIASFLVHGPQGLALIECGPSTTRARLVAELAARGIEPGQIGHVLVTHIHLDHAGCAWWWARQGAQVYVHDQGAPHLVDPSKLMASATRIYGDRMDSLWGPVEPCPADRVTAVRGGQTLAVAGLKLRALDTPGHARHHFAFRLENLAFTGDIAGVRMPGEGYISVPAPPPEFDLEAWLESLKRLQGESLQQLYLTHFGVVDQAGEHLARLAEQLPQAAEFVKAHLHLDRDTLVKEYYAWVQARAGVPDASFNRYEQANPLFMSVDGITRYWRKRLAA